MERSGIGIGDALGAIPFRKVIGRALLLPSLLFGELMANKKKRVPTKNAPLVPLAGIDIGSTFHVVAVPGELDSEPVRSFKSFTADLNALADWLVALGITTVAMESTGIYGIPVFEILEDRGLSGDPNRGSELIRSSTKCDINFDTHRCAPQCE